MNEFRDFGKTDAGQGLLSLCLAFGKFPHEFDGINRPEWSFLVSAWNERNKPKK